ncbi:MAG TPA: hypothetical protein VH502_04245 [Actinoplanes sp.]
MPTPPATGNTTARTVDDQFLDLICSDADLLAAEFDAIIAAEWREPPADRPGRGAAGEHPGSGAARRAAEPVRGPVPRHGTPASADGHGSAHPRPAPDARQAEGR